MKKNVYIITAIIAVIALVLVICIANAMIEKKVNQIITEYYSNEQAE